MNAVRLKGAMTDLSYTDILALVQTLAIIVALLITLYFSRRQAQLLTADLESRVLNDIDEKFHHIGELFIARPDLVQSIYKTPSDLTAETPLAYYLLAFCGYIFHMRQRKLLADNEWSGWLQWMKNAFQKGTISETWKTNQMESWFDPAFQRFVNEELMGAPPES